MVAQLRLLCAAARRPQAPISVMAALTLGALGDAVDPMCLTAMVEGASINGGDRKEGLWPG